MPSGSPHIMSTQTPHLTEEQIWNALRQVMDPEIPVVSLVELGVVRSVETDGQRVTVTMTPTFSGCPALIVMQQLVADKVKELGAAEVDVKMVLDPPWSSDWITPEAREKLRAFGLAPPPVHGGDLQIKLNPRVTCPRCGSDNVTIKNRFGSTLCRAIYYCNDCQDAFEQFKPL